MFPLRETQRPDAGLRTCPAGQGLPAGAAAGAGRGGSFRRVMRSSSATGRRPTVPVLSTHLLVRGFQMYAAPHPEGDVTLRGIIDYMR